MSEKDWISVKDRLPEYGDEYNVVWDFEKNGNHVVTTMEFDAKEKKWFDTAGIINSDCTDEVTYWMPLPEPPKQNEP